MTTPAEEASADPPPSTKERRKLSPEERAKRVLQRALKPPPTP